MKTEQIMSEHFPKLLSRVDLLQKYVSVPSPTQDAALPGTEKQQPTNLSIAFTNMCPFPVKIALFQSYDPICACAVGWPQEPLERVLKISDSVDMQLPDGEKYIMKVYKPSVVDKEYISNFKFISIDNYFLFLTCNLIQIPKTYF